MGSCFSSRQQIIEMKEEVSGLRRRLQLVEQSESCLAKLANARLEALARAQREQSESDLRIEHLSNVNARIELVLIQSQHRVSTYIFRLLLN